MRERARKKGKVFCSQRPTILPFLWCFLKPAVESGCGLDQNYIVEDELRFFFFQLSQRLATIRASAYSCSETKLFSFVPLITIEHLFVLHCQTFCTFLSLYIFMQKRSVSHNTFSALSACIKWPRNPRRKKICCLLKKSKF